jgi:hypothetical protein
MWSRREFNAAFVGSIAATAQELPDIRTIPADLVTPEMVVAEPAAGRRVRHVHPAYAGTAIHHALYLPPDWRRGAKYPLIVEYAGNGNYKNQWGDISTGRVEGSNLGFGLSGGEGQIWLCLPYVNPDERRNEMIWWGDPAATAEYCKKAVPWVCEHFGGDPGRVILCGFSRGAIACNYIGLRDDEIARFWSGFLPYSHYDGVKTWPYADSGRDAALTRLQRLRGRPQFICHERSIDETRDYLAGAGVRAPFTFQAIDFRNHNDAWVLRDIPERRLARRWLKQVWDSPRV